MLQYFNERFPETLMPVMTAELLIPAKILKLTPTDVDAILKQYERDLPSSMNFIQEVDRWTDHCKDMPDIKTLVSALNLAKVGNMFPNITTIFELLLTLPVGFCSCERSFSAMRRLKTWQRSTMEEERFNGLALMNIHSNNDVGHIDPINVLKRFDPTGHLRIGRLFCESDAKESA